ncbi:MAG: hypothetical protein ABR981_01845 [Candidatus Micrarchaeaceae archaeon]|jgi:hypothetical protein
MKITLCSSAKFFDKLYKIKEELEKRGYEVFLPSMQDFHHLEETALAKIQYDLIRDHFRKIDKSNAIYVANYDKNGIEGYIGGGALLEMGKAFDKEIPIFLMKDIPRQISYREELIALKPIVIGENWELLDKHLKS